MMTVNLSPPPLSLSSDFLPPLKLSSASSTLRRRRSFNQNRRFLGRRGRVICSAELSQDAPFAIAIGTCMLNSLLFPYVGGGDEEGEENSVISATDARFTVMSIISFIPYFNWLSWIFAFMDTGKRRYAVYAAVYLAPYIRTNLSISPEESWLPIASIVLCIVHVQLEASIRNGDIDGFTFFNEAAKRFGLISESNDVHRRRNMHEEERPNDINLPSGKALSRDEIRRWKISRKPSRDLEDEDDNDDEKIG